MYTMYPDRIHHHPTLQLLIQPHQPPSQVQVLFLVLFIYQEPLSPISAIPMQLDESPSL